jgi:diadenosine tetraphosphate (Ap4A) HIT family hydrolase
MAMTFQVHPQLQQDSIEIGRFSLCQLRLINDSQYPWFVLVPAITNVTEIYQLLEKDQTLLQQESSFLARKLSKIYKADKMNIASIGNLVPQLHIHHIVRYKKDIAWPAPVWGKFDAIPYNPQQLEIIKSQIKEELRALLNE